MVGEMDFRLEKHSVVAMEFLTVVIVAVSSAVNLAAASAYAMAVTKASI